MRHKRSEQGQALILTIVFAMIGLVGLATWTIDGEKSQSTRRQPGTTAGVPALATGLVWFSNPANYFVIQIQESLVTEIHDDSFKGDPLPRRPDPWQGNPNQFPTTAIPADRPVNPGLQRQRLTSRLMNDAEQLRKRFSSQGFDKSSNRRMFQLWGFDLPQKQPCHDFQGDGDISLIGTIPTPG